MEEEESEGSQVEAEGSNSIGFFGLTLRLPPLLEAWVPLVLV